MPELLGSHDFFAETVTVEGKGEAEIVLLPLPTRVGAAAFDKPRREARTSAADNFVAAGDVVRLQGGERFILGDDGAGVGGVTRTWVLFFVTGDYHVRRQGTYEDAVTGLPRPAATTAWTAPMCVEPVTEKQDGSTRVPSEAYRAVTGADLRTGDVVTVDGFDRTARRVDLRMGVRVADLW